MKPDKSLIEKLRDMIEQHHRETGERVISFYVDWFFTTGGKANIEKINIDIQK